MNSGGTTGTLAAACQAALIEQPGRELQFKLRGIQSFNWGTFDKLRDIVIAPEGHLVLGPSGSGKSTLLDGHTSLLTPPKWIDFNSAARHSEKGTGDRSWVTYVRGAWANQTGEEGEKVKRYLRSGTTWSALSETYKDGLGRTVVVGRILWIKGSSCAEADVHKLLFVAERDFSLRELEFFESEGNGFDVRRLKAKMSDVYFTDEFSGYQAKFTRLFGIASDRALRLLHKTQSAKDMGDLNKFLRDFMLDPPETVTLAETLVNEFQVLDAAHQAVLTARQQIEALRPVRESLVEHTQARSLMSLLSEERGGVDYWREQHRRELLLAQVAELTTKAAGLSDAIEQFKTHETRAEGKYNALLTVRAGAGGNILASLNEQLDRAERIRVPEVAANHDRMRKACTALGWGLPATPHGFAEAQAESRVLVDGREAMMVRHETELDRLKEGKRAVETRFTFLLGEIRAMEGRTSNMPSQMLEIRERMCRELRIPEEDLPFVGELLQVKAKEALWTGAAERVLGGFATSLLVEEHHYRDVAGWVDRTNLGQRLVYLRMTPRAAQGAVAQPSADSLIRKLEVAPKHKEWLSDELRRFDYACVGSADELRAIERGVTLAGQVKHSRSRHEKDDRKRIDDRRSWVLGFSNVDKLKAYKDEARDAGEGIGNADQALEKARAVAKLELEQSDSCRDLVNLTWENTNIAGVLDEVKELKSRIEAELRARPELSELDEKLKKQKKEWERTTRERQGAEGDARSAAEDLIKSKKRLDEIPADSLEVRLTPTQQERLETRFAATGKKLSAETVDGACTQMMRAIGEEELEVSKKADAVKARIEQLLYVFCNRWEAEAKGLDPKLESAPDFMAKLERLETDGLHEYVARFKDLLREQSDQNLAVLHARLDQERRSIGERLEQVNDSLRRCSFNESTYLVIDYKDRPTQEVGEFRAQLKAALSHSFKEDDDDEMERRFAALNSVVKRLGSQEPSDVKWRGLVLDVRQHVEFLATEFDDTGIEVETYDSGAGKSGGQRQKLTTTVLAAALRYQLAGEEGEWPSYSTVVMDEAFDRADNEFTAMVMTIFNKFGFQVVAATPVKNVMALEPFIGGGTFISIRDRKHSEALAITYLPQSGRLDLPLEAQDVLAEELAEEEGGVPS